MAKTTADLINEVWNTGKEANFTVNGTTYDFSPDGLKTYINASALVSPALSGTPTAPTATVGTNTTQLATTAFVQSATKSKTQTVALTAVVVADATDLPTAIALANANKVAINAIIAALKA